MSWWHPPMGMAAACREPISATATTTATVSSIVSAAATAASTVAGIAATVMGAQAQANAQRGQARAAAFAAEQERTRGIQAGNQLREALLRTLAGQRARYSAAGLVADEGSALSLQEQTALQAERELTITRDNATIRSEQQRMQAGLLEGSADWTETGGYIRAGINLFDAVDRYAQRQPGSTTRPGNRP